MPCPTPFCLTPYRVWFYIYYARRDTLPTEENEAIRLLVEKSTRKQMFPSFLLTNKSIAQRPFFTGYFFYGYITVQKGKKAHGRTDILMYLKLKNCENQENIDVSIWGLTKRV